MRRRGLQRLGALTIAAVMLTACGGADDNNSGDRPTINELQSMIIASSGVDATYASCLADGLQMSTLPNGVVRRVAAGEPAEVDEDHVEGYEQILDGIKVSCDAFTSFG